MFVYDKTLGHTNVWFKDEDTDLNDYSAGGYPKKLHIELSAKCNLACKHCSGRYMPHACISKTMPIETINAVINDFFKKVSAIRIGGSSYGEPMVSEHFTYFLEKIKEYAIDTELVTNGTLITEENARLIAEAVSYVLISVEGIGKNYRINRGEKWEKVENNIDLVVQQRDRLKEARVAKIGLQITVKREFKNDCFKLIDFARDHRLDLLLLQNFCPGPGEFRSSLFYYEKEHNNFYDELQRYASGLGVKIYCPVAIPQEKSRRNIFMRLPCAQPFEAFGILPNSKILTCCKGPIDFGEYSPGEKKVMEKWQSQEFIFLRKTVNSDKPIDRCAKCDIRNCNPLAYIEVLNCRKKIYYFLKKYAPLFADLLKNLKIFYSNKEYKT